MMASTYFVLTRSNLERSVITEMHLKSADNVPKDENLIKEGKISAINLLTTKIADVHALAQSQGIELGSQDNFNAQTYQNDVVVSFPHKK